MSESPAEINTGHTVPERIWHWVGVQPEKVAISVVNAKGECESVISYRQLYQRAATIGRELSLAGLKDKNVVLLYPPGVNFISTFLGCMLEGIVPVPAHMPKQNRSNAKIVASINSSRASAVLLDRQARLAAERAKDKSIWPKNIAWLVTDEIAEGTEFEEYVKPQVSPDHPAFLQFTSGSTSTPKGVKITHANLMHNGEMMKQCAKTTRQSVFVNWMPHYHDLGLVGNILHSLYCGAHCVILSPVNVIACPYLWLDTIERYRGTYTAAPNFAYQRCVEKISSTDRDKLDLTSLKVAVNAAEPVHYQTLVEFTEYFQPAGLDPNVFLPCYGMAEATVFIAGGEAQTGSRFIRIDSEQYQSKNRAVLSEDQTNSIILVGCGRGWLDMDIKIVNPDTHRCVGDWEVGEIWITGGNVMSEYYENPELNMDSLVVLTENGKRYFRTGDLGFFDANHELYISGRLKDLIIIAGVNYYPQDIEYLVKRPHKTINTNGVAAVGLMEGTTEHLIIAVELDRESVIRVRKSPSLVNEYARSICEAVSQNFEIIAQKIVLLRPGQLPKTSSGKICRQEFRRFYLNHMIEPLAIWPVENKIDIVGETKAENNIEQTLQIINQLRPEQLKVFSCLLKILNEELRLTLADLDMEKSIFFYGIDSIKLVDLHTRLEQNLGYWVPTELFFYSSSLLSLIDQLVENAKSPVHRISENQLRDDIQNWLHILTLEFSSISSSFTRVEEAGSAVFLTGATGYVGIYLLKELLVKTERDIYCLVRAVDEESGWLRMQKNAERYLLMMPDNWRERVKVVIGDTSKDSLGLTPKTYFQLAEHISSVFHCAAIDNFYLPYEVLKATNVLGLVHIVRFCMENKLKSLHYVSSCAAALLDETPKAESIGLVNGYAKTKFVTEQIVLGLIDKGFPATNYRLGYLYSLEADMADKDESFETFLTAIYHLRCLPDIDMVFDLTPVEYAVKCIMQTALQSNRRQTKRNYTFYNPVPLNWIDVSKYLLKSCSDMKIVALPDFVERFQEYVFLSKHKSLKLLKSLVSEKLEQQINQMFHAAKYDDIGLVREWCPPCDKSFVIHYISLVLGTTEEFLPNCTETDLGSHQ